MSDPLTIHPPIAEGLFALDGEQPVLIGSRCGACGTVTFPEQGSCPRCTSDDVAEHRLATTGPLWTWTSQDFRPKSPPYAGPEAFASYLVGYVELGGEVRVEGLLTGVERADVRIGMPMRTTAIATTGAGGEARTTFAFAPADEEAS